MIAVASIPRALFAAGVDQKLNHERVADSALINFTDRHASWFEDISRLPNDYLARSSAWLQAVLRKYYDLLRMPDVRMNSDAEYIARVSELLDEGVRACLAGFRTPRRNPVGGARHAASRGARLAALPPGAEASDLYLPPGGWGFDGRLRAGALANERPLVEAFAAMHPGLEPHFTANDGYGHDHRWNEFFHLMSGAPSGLCNMYVFHGLFTERGTKRLRRAASCRMGKFHIQRQRQLGICRISADRPMAAALAGDQECFANDSRPFPVRLLIRLVECIASNGLWKLAKRIYRRGRRLTAGHDAAAHSASIGMRPGRRNGSRPRGLRSSATSRVTVDTRSECCSSPGTREGAEIYQAFEADVRSRYARSDGVSAVGRILLRPAGEDVHARRQVSAGWERRWPRASCPKNNATIASTVAGIPTGICESAAGRNISPNSTACRQMSNSLTASIFRGFARRSRTGRRSTPTELTEFFTREFAVPRALLTARFIQYIEGRNS